MEEEYNFVVDEEYENIRIDAFLLDSIRGASREKIKNAIQDGQCFIDEVCAYSPSLRLRLGQQVMFFMAVPESTIQAEEGDVDILYSDDYIAVTNKPPGITVHPCDSCPQGTFIQRVMSHFPQLRAMEGLRPGIVHRLDKDTSGLLVVALTEEARLTLSENFAHRDVTKEYLAIVQGVPSREGSVREPIGRHPTVKVKMAIVPHNKGGRAAHTEWTMLYADPRKQFALLRVQIFTGRTHQIRVHLAHAGFPILGDALYNPHHQQKPLASRQMLHAQRLNFPHPGHRQRVNFFCPAPDDLLACMMRMSSSHQRVVITGLPGCGKTALLKEFAAMKIPVWSADAVVASLYKAGGEGQKYLMQRFGTVFVQDAATDVNRATLRVAMEKSEALRYEVEGVIHQYVHASLRAFWTKYQSLPVSVAEVPLYLEKNWGTKNDTYVIGLDCDIKIRYTRLMTHRKWTLAQCKKMDSWQMPREEKMRACSIILQNNKTVDVLKQMAGALAEKFKILRKTHHEKLNQLLHIFLTQEVSEESRKRGL